VRLVQPGPTVGLLAQPVLLGALTASVGLGAAGWLTGLLCATVACGLLAAALARSGTSRLGPADRVTLTRTTLACGVAALVADSFVTAVPVRLLVGLATVALLLDAVDGYVARRTRTTSPLGARFDMEADAFLILVLSVYAAAWAGPWVLAIGLARYALGAAGRLLPWLRRPSPPRPWAKVVAAVQGIVLTVAAAGVLPHRLVEAGMLVALLLLAESFGRQVWWLWRHRAPAHVPTQRAPEKVSA
jgi:phosphatidylglycerophosphate synthase